MNDYRFPNGEFLRREAVEIKNYLKRGCLIMKKILALLLAVVMVFGMTGCDLLSNLGGEPDPNVGKYLGVSCEVMEMVMDIDEVYPGDNYLELKNGGKVELVLEGDKMPGKWTLEGVKLNLVIEGEDCPGTLKDGVIVFDLIGTGVILTFVKEGVTPPTKPAETLEPGYYPLYAVEQDGEYNGNDIITAAGLDKGNYILVNEDKTVLAVMEGEKLEAVMKDGKLVADDGSGIPFVLKDGLVELHLEGNMIFYYKKGDIKDMPTEPEGAVFPDYVAQEFYGDWHGWCSVVNATGAYEDDLGEEFEMLARYAIDANGVCTPWMAIASSADSNFKDLVLTYNEDDTFVYLAGQLFGMPIDSSASRMYSSFGSLCLEIHLADDDGTLQIAVTLRHPNAVWDEYDFPCMPQGAIDFYSDKTFEQRVELYGLDPADLPELP